MKMFISCIKDFLMVNGERRFTAKKSYRVTKIPKDESGSFSIINDIGNNHHLNVEYVRKYFAI